MPGVGRLIATFVWTMLGQRIESGAKRARLQTSLVLAAMADDAPVVIRAVQGARIANSGPSTYDSASYDPNPVG